MTPLEHLRVIDKLAFDKSAYCEFREHVIAVQEALETYAKKESDFIERDKEHLKLIASNKELYLRFLEAKSDIKNYEAQRDAKSGGESEFGSGLKHDI